MPLSPEWIDPRVNEGVADIASLGRFDGPPKEFWGAYLGAVQKLAGASCVLLFFRQGPEEDWRRAAEVRASPSPGALGVSGLAPTAVGAIATHADEHGGCALAPRELFASEELPPAAADIALLAVAPAMHATEEACLLVAILDDADESGASEALVRLKLAAAVPEIYQRNRGGQRAGEDVKRIATALDLNVLSNRERNFTAAALAFCNGAAAGLNCDRTSLGWVSNGLVKLCAISRTEKFDRKMEAAQALEAAMDETLDQDDEIVWPASESTPVIARDHARFAESQSSGHVASLPLRVDDRPVAVLTCERGDRAFDDTELAQLRLAVDLATPRLAELKQRDRWFGARAATAVRDAAANILGPSHTWTKIAALLATISLAVLVFVQVPYRVEGDFVMRSDEVSYVAAPLDSYIARVHARAGDRVEAGQPLISLDRTQLELERAAATADLARFERETEKARAERKLAEMGIAAAQADQATARLKLIEHRLAQSEIVSPFDAYVVEGDQRDRIGAPVKQGDVLFRLARIDSLYVEAKVDERDVHEIETGGIGEIAFVSRPEEKFDVRIVNLVPAAVPDPAGNTFIARCELGAPLEEWARPGMSGVCKLSAGERSLGHIFTHRTVDFLRMFFWW